ncbi:MAG: hypothetical protein HFE63_01615 [Clostridiales bacterium]|nr:hypothetical protein [Clostridiales bacterium]
MYAEPAAVWKYVSSKKFIKRKEFEEFISEELII